MYFDELPLEDEILDALWDMHFDECTPVQAETIPVILDGRDVISCAQTGTGKTAAYILPLLSNLLTDNHDPNAVNAIIMAPTRELAQQIDQQMEGFSFYSPFSSVAVYGGNDGNAWDIQKRGLTHGADVVIATPGRLISHINLYKIDFSKVKYFILDEADRMLDMGFFDDILTIVNQLPKERQTIMFSATMPTELRRLAKGFMNDPVEVNIAISRPPETIRQQAYICYDAKKEALIQHILKEKEAAAAQTPPSGGWGAAGALSKIIVFAGKKQTVRDLTRVLRQQKIDARAMHSDLEQKERDEVMLDFRNGKVGVLVATDIVSRGIDVDDIPLVINYDVPRDAEDYVHRIGRTARAANSGEAITLVGQKDQTFFGRIEEFLEKEVEKLPMPAALGEAPEYRPQKKATSKYGKSHRGGKNKRNYSKRKDKQRKDKQRKKV